MLPEDKVLIDDYLATLTLADRSWQLYYDCLRLFADFMETRGGLPNATCADAEEYAGGHSPATYNFRMSVLRPFYLWCAFHFNIPPNPIMLIKSKRPLPAWERSPLSLEDADRAARTRSGDDRDELVCRLALHLGLKPAEITGIALEDVSIEPQPMVLCGPLGKRAKRRIVELDLPTARLAHLVKAQRQAEGAAPQDPLIASRSNNNRGGRMTAQAINVILRKALEPVGTSPKSMTRRKTPGQDAAPRVPLTPEPRGRQRKLRT